METPEFVQSNDVTADIGTLKRVPVPIDLGTSISLELEEVGRV